MRWTMSNMTEAQPVSSIPALDTNTQLEMLLSRILSGEPLMLDTPQPMLRGGAPSLLRRPDEQSPLREDDIRVTKKPVVSPPS